MGRVTNLRSALYHAAASELNDMLYIIGQKVGIKNKTQRAKLDQAVAYFLHMSADREGNDSLYIRTHIKDGIQKAIFMKDESIDEDMIRQNNLLSASYAIISVRYGRSQGYFEIEVFIPI